MALPPILPAPKSKGPALPPILPAPKPARPSRPAPPPVKTNVTTGANPRGTTISRPVPLSRAPKPTVNDRAAQTLTTGANPRGTAIVQRPQQPTKSDLHAVYDTFRHQDQPTQVKLVQNAVHNPSPEGRILIAALRAHVPKGSHLNLGAGTGRNINAGPNILQALGHAFDPKNVYGGASKSAGGQRGGILATATPTFGTPVNTFKGAKTLLGNLGKDAYQFGPETIMGGAQVVSDIAHGHFGNAFHAFADPFVQMGRDPGSFLYHHPGDSLLMAAGPEAVAGRVLGGAARAGVFGDRAAGFASTAREPLHLGTIGDSPSPFHEARSYSRNLITQAAQKQREALLRKRGIDPNIARPAPRFLPHVLAHAMNIGGEAKLNRIADEMSAMRQSLGRQERARVLDQVRNSQPHKDVRNVTSHILQGVVRSPETAVEDITKEISRLKAAQTGKRTVQDLFNKRQIRDLTTALQNPDKLHEAFDAAAHLRPLIKAQDAYLVAHGLLDESQAGRRAMLPYALAHMGARFDPVKEAFVRADGTPLPDAEILDHLQGWRNVQSPNPAKAEAQSERNQASINHNDNQAAHYAATQAHRAAADELKQARDEFGAAGGPTPKEQRLIDLVKALRDRPGTPGEAAAAQARLDAILKRIEGRGAAGISRDRLTAAEGALDAAVAHRAVTRRAAQDSAKTLRDAERKVRDTPDMQTIRVHSGVETPDPAYVGHFPGKVSAANFYRTYHAARGTLGDSVKQFTGKAFASGGYDHTFEGLAGQVASRAEAVSRASLHDKVVSRLGIKMPREMQNQLLRQLQKDVAAGRRTAASASKEAELIKAGLFTRDEAQHFANAATIDSNHNAIPGSIPLTAISAHPVSALDHVKDLQNPSELTNLSSIELRALQHAIEDAKHSTARNVTLIPTAAADRFARQFQRADQQMRHLGRFTQQFRRTVLPYSTHWMLQIGSEAGLRALLAGALDPRYLSAGRRLTTRLEKTEAGRAALAEMTNQTLYNSRDPLSIHTANRGVISSAAHALPPTRLIIGAHNRYANLIGHTMYSLEHNARVLGLGQLAHREVSEFSRSWQNAVHLQGQAIEHLARKLESDPALVAKLGRQIDDTFGKYNKFTPSVRAAVQSYAPFLPWYLNAAKYVLWHLPAKSPVASSLLASLRMTVNQDIADGKQLPLSAWAMQALARFTPFGIFTPDSPNPSLSGVVKGQDLIPGAVGVPQLQGALYNLAGINSFGEGPLKGPQGDVKAKSNAAIGASAESLAEAIVPLVSKVRAALEGGRPSYGTSTLWNPQPKPQQPGQSSSILNRILNPLYGFERSSGGPSYAGPGGSSPGGDAGVSGSVLPGEGSTNGVVIPGHGGDLSNVVIP